MKPRTLVALASGLVMLVPAGAMAQGGPVTYQVSGGGQVLVSASGGPGTTIAFTAQGQGENGDENARGQFQLVERDGPGSPQIKFHGVVDCLIPDFVFTDEDDNTVEGARFGGQDRRTGERFLVDVVDNGEPVPGTDSDMLAYRLGRAHTLDANCGWEDEDDEDDSPPDLALARGNVKIHDRR